MDGKDAARSPSSAPHYPLSAEITPAEYEYYMQKAQQMRAESFASVLRALYAPLRRLFARAKPAPRHEPILVKSRTA